MLSAWKLKKCFIFLLMAASLANFTACQSSLRSAQARDETGGPVTSSPPPTGDYWTPERMKNAKPMPMPTVPDPPVGQGKPDSSERPKEEQPGKPGAAPGRLPEAPLDSHH